MPRLLLNTIALDPNRWTPDKVAWYRLDALLAPIRESGFRFVEVWQFHVSRESAAAVRRFRAQGEALGLRFPVVGLYPALHLTGAARRQALDEARTVLEHARLLDAEIVKLFPGTLASADAGGAAYARSVAFMRELAGYAADAGLTLTGETHAHTLFDSPASCRAFLEDVGADNFKVCYQPFRFTDTQRALADFKALHAHVVHVHYQGRRDGTMSLLEAADLDYAALTAALAEHGFDGHLCIEFVKDCVVDDPGRFDLGRVLRNARRDRDFVLKTAARHGMSIES